MSRSGPGPTDLYAELLKVNRLASAAGRYETAYHALMAALHSAQDEADPDRLEEVARLASEQRMHIDSAAPNHRLSSRSAAGHGNSSVFDLAAQQARAQAILARNRVRGQDSRISSGLEE